MLKNNNIKSFTLSEMVVVIVITSIVVGMAFTVLNLVQNQMKSITHNYAGTTQLHLLEQSLWIDLHKYQDISYHPEERSLHLKHELDSVTYIFDTDKIIKERDTFFVSVKNKKYFYKGKMITEGLLDAIQLQTGETQEAQDKTLFIFTKNDAANTINSWHFN